MNSQWQKREIAEHLIKAAGDLVESWDQSEDIDPELVRECLNTWLKRLPGRAWDPRLGTRG